MRCEAIAESLPGVVDGSARLDRAERRHVEQCLRCQAELAQYRKLLRAMRLLRTDVGAVPGRRVAYLGGIAAAATAAGAGAAIVLVSRGRRGRLPLAG